MDEMELAKIATKLRRVLGRYVVTAFFCVSALVSLPTWALGLGAIEGKAIIGSNLQMMIPILGELDATPKGGCLSLRPEGDVEGLQAIQLLVSGKRIILTTSRPVTQPMLQFSIRIGCASPVERRYVVLPESAAQVLANTSAQSKNVTAPGDTGGASPSGKPDTSLPVSSPALPRKSFTVLSTTTLRMISRQRYPNDADARINFIRSMSEANPAVFSSLAVAFDQKIRAGTVLAMPSVAAEPRSAGADKPVPKSSPTPPEVKSSMKPSVKPEVKVGRDANNKASGGRLVIGGAAAANSRGGGPSAAELNDSMARLIEIMNEQIKVQVTTIERVKSLETELADYKRQVELDRQRMTKFEAELQAVREDAHKTATIQLLLAILAGGVLGALALLWFSQRSSRDAVKSGFAPLSDSPLAVAVRGAQAKISGKSQEKLRLVTSADLDGLVCAILLRETNLVEEVVFTHADAINDGKVSIGESDIVANLPFKAANLVFNHRRFEDLQSNVDSPKHILDLTAFSTARVIFDYYGGKKVFAKISDAMMLAVDKSESAQFSRDEIFFPTRWVLLGFLIDSSTGLDRFGQFRVSSELLMAALIKQCRSYPIDDIVRLPDVRERVDIYLKHATKAREQLRQCTTIHANLAVVDLRKEDPVWATNRFMIYAIFPQVNISIELTHDAQKRNTVCVIGKSILDRSSRTNVGEVVRHYGGSGHAAFGRCEFANENASTNVTQMIARISAEG